MKSIPAPPIPVNEPLIGETAAAYVAECIETGWVSSQGRFIGEFEDAWARYCGGEVGVAGSVQQAGAPGNGGAPRAGSGYPSGILGACSFDSCWG